MKDHTQFADSLALYALSAEALDNAQERAELEAHLRECSECRSELEALRGDAALLGLSAVGPAPPRRARQRLMAAIEQEPRFVPAPPRRMGVLRSRWFAIAPIAATLVLAIFSLMMWKQASTLRTRLESARAALAEQQAQLQDARAMLDLIHSPDAMHKTLVALKAPPQPQIKTIYSPEKQRLLLVASSMEALPAGKVYELWLLPANGGAPVPAGTFTPDARGNAIMDHTLAGGLVAKEFAITIEDAAGSQTPTMPIRMMSAG
jgi:hypothetical protein